MIIDNYVQISGKYYSWSGLSKLFKEYMQIVEVGELIDMNVPL